MIITGQRAERVFVVTAQDTAAAHGSGDLDVLATPRLLAWCERVTCETVGPDLRPEDTTVGVRVSLEHLAASPIGAAITVAAEVTYVDGRLLTFQVSATDEAGRLVGHGEVRRVTVDRERFLARLG
jgi:fluoroacetyl-CoA thioesterase